MATHELDSRLDGIKWFPERGRQPGNAESGQIGKVLGDQLTRQWTGCAATLQGVHLEKETLAYVLGANPRRAKPTQHVENSAHTFFTDLERLRDFRDGSVEKPTFVQARQHVLSDRLVFARK